jgi:hypothetical protein
LHAFLSLATQVDFICYEDFVPKELRNRQPYTKAEYRVCSLCKSSPAEYHHIISQVVKVFVVSVFSFFTFVIFIATLNGFVPLVDLLKVLPFGCGIVNIHDKANMMALCIAHHGAVHKGWLTFDKV